MSQTASKEGFQAGISISGLPTELVIDIFHYACTFSTSFSSALCQLSTWTRRIALPYLFSTVVIKKLGNKQEFSKMLNQTPIHPPRSDFKLKDYLESLWLEAVSNRTLTIFRACDNVVNLALPVDNLMWKKDLRLLILNAKKPNWSLRNCVSNDPTLTSPFFAKITHLRIGLVGPYTTHLDLAHFTRLSHIAIPYHQPENQNLPDLLRVFNFSSAVFLVVVLLTDILSDTQYQEALDWVKQTRVTNPKVYVVTSRQPDLQTEWEEEVRRGLSIWDKAERFTFA